MKINVVCVKHGTLYDHTDVNKLYSMVKRNLTIEFDFFCITENSSKIHKDIICISPPIDWVQKQWLKETMFLKGTLPEKITLYLDLDVVIVSSLNKLIPKDDTLWCMSKNFEQSSIPVFHGAVMVFNPKYWYSFFNFFKSQVDNGYIMDRGKEQPLIARFHLKNSYKNFKVFPNNWIWSFKYGHLRDEINEFNRGIYRGYKPPKGGVICSFHGSPDAKQVLDLEYIDKHSIKWIKDNWYE